MEIWQRIETQYSCHMNVPAHHRPSLSLGEGIFTVRDMSLILGVPAPKIRAWLKRYWDGRFGKHSWEVKRTKAVNFHTLVEFYITLLLKDEGVPSRTIFKAHEQLSSIFDTPYPFAYRDVLTQLRCDGKRIYLDTPEGILSLDGTNQLNLDFIRDFLKNLEFGDDLLPSKLYPRGKKSAIVVDPQRQFGHPIIDILKTNEFGRLRLPNSQFLLASSSGFVPNHFESGITPTSFPKRFTASFWEGSLFLLSLSFIEFPNKPFEMSSISVRPHDPLH